MPQAPDNDLIKLAARIAAALERMAPPPPPEPDFSAARLFRYEAEKNHFLAAPDYALPLDMLMGVDRQKARVMENLRRFAEGLPANNALLWGTRGTGKSSMTKAAFMVTADSHPSLRMVELDRDHITALPDLFEILRGRPERFVVLCDDLSFEEGAAAAKSLKSALEGGVAGPPENVVLFATSNRRHLMPRTNSEGSRGLIATAEDAEEEVSVSDRFGLWIGFPPMDQTVYLEAVHAYAAKFGLEVDNLETRALQWSVLRGSRSGRVAWQFVRDLAGELGKGLPL